MNKPGVTPESAHNAESLPAQPEPKCTCKHMHGHEGCRAACDVACGCVLHDGESDSVESLPVEVKDVVYDAWGKAGRLVPRLTPSLERIELPPLPKPLRTSAFWDDGIEWHVAGERAARLEREQQLLAEMKVSAGLRAELRVIRERQEFEAQKIHVEWSDRSGNVHPSEFWTVVLSCSLDHSYDRTHDGVPNGIPDEFRDAFAPIVARHLSACNPNWQNVTVNMTCKQREAFEIELQMENKRLIALLTGQQEPSK